MPTKLQLNQRAKLSASLNLNDNLLTLWRPEKKITDIMKRLGYSFNIYLSDS